jgi:hypothetical protein
MQKIPFFPCCFYIIQRNGRFSACGGDEWRAGSRDEFSIILRFPFLCAMVKLHFLCIAGWKKFFNLFHRLAELGLWDITRKQCPPPSKTSYTISKHTQRVCTFSNLNILPGCCRCASLFAREFARSLFTDAG